MRHHLATVTSAFVAAAALALSWAWAQGVVIAVAAFCAALVAIVSGVRTLSSLKPVRWLWRQLVGDPLDRAFEHRVLSALKAWWDDEDGPGPRLAKLEAAAERVSREPS